MGGFVVVQKVEPVILELVLAIKHSLRIADGLSGYQTALKHLDGFSGIAGECADWRGLHRSAGKLRNDQILEMQDETNHILGHGVSLPWSADETAINKSNINTTVIENAKYLLGVSGHQNTTSPG
jgi:hypothetical protein